MYIGYIKKKNYFINYEKILLANETNTPNTLIGLHRLSPAFYLHY